MNIIKYIAILLLAISGSVYADFQKGMDAYKHGDYSTALQELTPIAEQGNVEAQNTLGNMHLDGKGVIQDYEKAFKWFNLAAESGNSYSQYMLGLSYQNGLGVIQDNVKAHMWFNISASQGNISGAAMRDTIEKLKMSPTEIKKAQKLARECVAKNYKDC